MIFTAATAAAAAAIAADLRRIYAGQDWVVRIARPLFPGDAYRVTIGC